jgi:hypothetical protein
MNVNDVESPETPANMLQAIFKKQHELSKRYLSIEIKSGIGYGILFDTDLFDINEQRCQYLCKDFAWRITEELAECTECLDNMDHAREELIDALHFLIELYIICGIDAKKIGVYSIDYLHDHDVHYNGPREDCNLVHAFLLANNRFSDCTYTTIRSQTYSVIEYIGRAMNCLKQKPWKQTHVLTDIRRFELNLCLAFYEWVAIARLMRMSPQSVYDCYFKKSEVNKFRQRSQY